jgi:hypothetical protein
VELYSIDSSLKHQPNDPCREVCDWQATLEITRAD